MLPLCVVIAVRVLLRLAFSDLQLLHETVFLLFAAHEAHVEAVFLFALLVQDVLLFVEGLLKTCLVFLQTLGIDFYITTFLLGLLSEGIVLNERLLE